MFYRADFACDDAEPLQQTLNQLYEYGDDLETKVLHRLRLNLFAHLLAELSGRGELRQKGAALDVGCNAGVYSRMLSDHGFADVLGIDVVPEMIDKAERTFATDAPGHQISFRLTSAVTFEPPRLYDFILCTEVIEHTEDPPRMIENLRRWIAPGGIAVVSLPNRLSLPYLTAWLAYKLRGVPRNQDFENHLEYPSFRSRRLFTGGDRRLIHTDGTNLFWTGRLLRPCYGRAFFPALNRAAFELARVWPFREVAQFFYVVVRRDPARS